MLTRPGWLGALLEKKRPPVAVLKALVVIWSRHRSTAIGHNRDIDWFGGE